MYGLMDHLMGAFGVVVIIFYLLANSIFTAWLASEKERSSVLWFFLGLFFGFIALLAIGFAPNGHTYSKINANYSKIDLSQVAPVGNFPIDNSKAWICKKCGATNPDTTDTCKDCGNYK
jgi:hypothetical protein